VLQLYETVQGRRTVFERFITHEKFAKFNPYGADIEAMLQREACKPPIYASQATCRGFFRLDFTERLSEVRIPALILCGNDDKPVPLETASQVLAEKIPDARLVTVQDTGHFPHMEKPEIVNEAIWKWLEEKIPQ
jgi:pimeloyl-ACP methyl ester carboxylesterase